MSKKTTYALKTPRAVALPFMYGVEYVSDPAGWITHPTQKV